MSGDNVTPIRPWQTAAGAPPAKKANSRGGQKGPTAAQILAVIDRYQDPLLNLVHVVRCIKNYTSQHCDEIAGAVELVEDELANIAEALEVGVIKRAAVSVRKRDADD